MRAFIAIELPQTVKDFLSRIQNQLKASGADVKWVAPSNIHLTLKFLGEIEDKKLDDVIRALESALKDKNHFSIHLSSLGAFPKINYPRVIWVGIDKGDLETRQIALALDKELAKIGIPAQDKEFSSHITIGRLRSAFNRQGLINNMNNPGDIFKKDNIEFPVTRITLFKSTLTPKGPIYEALKEANLTT